MLGATKGMLTIVGGVGSKACSADPKCRGRELAVRVVGWIIVDSFLAWHIIQRLLAQHARL